MPRKVLHCVLFLSALAMASGAVAQGSPDIFWDNSAASGSGIRTFGCRLGVAPVGAQALLFIESLPLATGTTNPYRRRYTTVSPAGVHSYAEMGSSSTDYGMVSRTGQMVVYQKYPGVGGAHTPYFMMSTDYGQTFLPITLPTSAAYTEFGENGSSAFGLGNWEVNSSVIGEDGRLYALYWTTRPNVTGDADRYELNMLAVDVGRNQVHTVIDRITANGTAFTNNSYINVVSTREGIVAVVRPGREFTPRGGTLVYKNVPMAVVYDFASHGIAMINFGGTLGAANESRYRTGLPGNSVGGNFTDAHRRMLSTDGENIFLLNGAAPVPGGRIPLRLREFPKNPASYAGFFVNTEVNQPAYLPSWEPYMDLQSAAMDFGTYDTSFVGASGSIGGSGTVQDFTAKWGVGGIYDHSADIYFTSDAEQVSGITSVRRMRITNPNSPNPTLTEETVEDFPVTLLASMFGLPLSNFEITTYPDATGTRSHWGVEGAVMSTFGLLVRVPPMNFWFHITDIS